METQLEKIQIEEEPNNDGLQLNPIEVDEDYLKKWNESSRDFMCLTYNGKLLRETLYRVGGLGKRDLSEGNYFLLLKHVEDYYEDNITTNPKEKKHLAGKWCIIDKFGNEKVVDDSIIGSIYLIDNYSIIYTSNNKYYNIETGELYCKGSSMMESDEFLFIENAYDKDESKRGVWKIDKVTGEYEIFKKK